MLTPAQRKKIRMRKEAALPPEEYQDPELSGPALTHHPSLISHHPSLITITHHPSLITHHPSPITLSVTLIMSVTLILADYNFLTLILTLTLQATRSATNPTNHDS